MSYMDGKNRDLFSELDIIKETINVSDNATTPVSDFCVGATIETKNGKLYTGCNFELYSVLFTLCAERNAITKATSCGEKDFKRIYLYGHKRNEKAKRFISPCGICLQVMNEICDEDFEIILIKSETELEKYQLKDFLPKGFAKRRK